MEDFEEIFNQFKALRIESIGNLVIYNSKEYKRLSQESDRLFMELCEYVKPEGMALFLDYCNVITLLQGTAESVMYEQGFKDGFSLIKLMFTSNNT
ncbi:hypothetical protein [Paenibacillus xylanexedens]|uniref:hypothetical protein n=1 Tax=Paenibacillus xylanexedens TaxID=528191 RepID=UPI0011A85DD7|nr:hypothetical protein [Paenibacillus xylanexedens]